MRDGFGLGDDLHVRTSPPRLVAAVDYRLTVGNDPNGRVSDVVYPTGFDARYAYNSFGYNTQLSNGTTGQVYWTAQQMDAELHLLQQQAGNGVTTNALYDANTGSLLGIHAANGTAEVENLAFQYDVLGDLTKRQDIDQNLSESLVYDNLNRLTQSTIAGSTANPAPPTKSFAYDAIGNITSKSDVGTYAYPASGSARPHGVTSISGGEISTTFTYDANGNQTSGLGRTLAYSAFNAPTSVTQGTTTVSFLLGAGHERIARKDNVAGAVSTTIYMAEALTGTPVEFNLGASGAGLWTHYLMAGGGMVGFVAEHGDGSTFTRYFHKDHLGSVAVLTDENAAVVQRIAYDPWGKQRNATTWADDISGSLPGQDQSTRGFTGQEQLNDVALVHLNARLYDPTIGRFTSADSAVDNPGNAQALNRYSYVYDNPLSFTDPTGHSLFGFIAHIFSAPIRVASSIFHGVASFIRHNPEIAQIVAIVATAASGAACGPCAIGVAFATTALNTGVTSGKIGLALEAGLISAATTAASFGIAEGVGVNPSFGSTAFFEGIAAHAALGCLSAQVSGGSCGPGALSGGITAFAGPLINNQGFGFGVVANAVVGGVTSIAGGGKFVNGATTAAFAYVGGEISQPSENEDELGQSFDPAPGQTARPDSNQLQAIVSNPTINAQITDAWNASNPSGKPQEQGFWITQDPSTGALSTSPFEKIPGEPHALKTGPTPDDAIVFFHTHPIPPNMMAQGPSDQDLAFADRRGLPGIISSHVGIYYFGPSLRLKAPLTQ